MRTDWITKLIDRIKDRPTNRSGAGEDNYNWIENRKIRRIYGWIERHPWWSVLLALGLPLSWVFLASDFMNNPTWKVLNYELSVSLFTETIILIATVFLVKMFFDRRKADERKPVWDALYDSTRRIYEDVYDLVHHSLAETSRRRYDDGFICPWIDRNYTNYIKSNDKEGRSHDFLSFLIDELNENGIILPQNKKFNAFSSINIIYNEIENCLQRYGAFLVSDETGDIGSEIHKNMEFLRYVFLQLKRHTESTQIQESDVILKFEKEKKKKEIYILHIGSYKKFVIGCNELPFSDSKQKTISQQIIEHYAEGVRKKARGETSEGEKHRKEGDEEGLSQRQDDNTIKCDQMSAVNGIMDEYSVSTDLWIDADFERRYMKTCIYYYEFCEKLAKADNGRLPKPEINRSVVANAMLHLGRIYEIGIGDPANLDKAEKCYKIAKEYADKTAQTKENSDIHFQIGRMYMQRGKMREAKESFEAIATTSEQDHADAQFLLGGIYENEQLTDKSRILFQKAAIHYINASINASMRWESITKEFTKLIREGFELGRVQLAVSETEEAVCKIDSNVADFRLAEMCKKI